MRRPAALQALLRGSAQTGPGAFLRPLRPILAATGGHPLAIKLVAGQLISLPLSRVQVMVEARRAATTHSTSFYIALVGSAGTAMPGSCFS